MNLPRWFHYHCDHVGGNAALQERYRLPIAAQAWDGALINRRDAQWGDISLRGKQKGKDARPFPIAVYFGLHCLYRPPQLHSN